MDVIKVGEFRDNFKSYFEKAIYKDEAIIVSGPKNKSVVVLSLDNYNHLKSNQMETKAINWKDDFRYNESLHSTAQGLAATNSRLLRNYPDHQDAVTWKKEKEQWNTYEDKIKFMVISTEEGAINETDRIAKILNKALETEKYLDNRTKSVKL